VLRPSTTHALPRAAHPTAQHEPVINPINKEKKLAWRAADRLLVVQSQARRVRV